jgi:cyclopropane fatty-acyl-phospholipid synthase-like methyltransferase
MLLNLDLIEPALRKMDKSSDSATVGDLATVDEFRIGARATTEHLMEQLGFNQSDKLLHAGCGLGGASRFIAKNYRNAVTELVLPLHGTEVDHSARLVRRGAQDQVNSKQHLCI